MSPSLRHFLAAFLFSLAIPAFAQEMKTINSQGANIPYKTNPTPFEEHGSRVVSVLLLFALASGFVIYLIRKKKLHLTGFVTKHKHIKIIEQVKLNSKFTIYVIEFDQHNLLIGQSGDHIVCFSDKALQASEN